MQRAVRVYEEFEVEEERWGRLDRIQRQGEAGLVPGIRAKEEELRALESKQLEGVAVGHDAADAMDLGGGQPFI
jgi:hypothetical protein